VRYNHARLMPHLRRIVLFPIKSLDGVEVPDARILPSGALEADRRFAIADRFGKFINGKRNPAVHRLRAIFDAAKSAVILEATGWTPRTFRFQEDEDELNRWLSDFFAARVRVLESPDGFPDDTEASGPTIVSEATTREVASWFPHLRAEDVHRRFRANLEIAGVPAFWEDQLFGEPGTVVDFAVGDVRLEGSNPCARCVVPTRDQVTGDVYAEFQKTFIARRKESLPSWAPVSRFDHYYRLCVNTRIPNSQKGKTLRIGDEVTLLGTRRTA
jgi:uncharacterized protein YcbX